MSFGDTFWSSFWLIVELFLFIAYLFVLFNIITDIFRDTRLGGVAKAVWIFFLIVFPVLTAIVYLIARGDGIEQRRTEAAMRAQKSMDNYIREAAGSNPSREIAEAEELRRAGVITDSEFEQLKAKALS
ncbi:MAG: PLDc N-terminal domain-containing protein [Ancrocorticia sp.]|jgi:hypothetical protein|nr:PLDc N-terminal domain-containing protein [Ancrocorticia sp.]MCI1933063.1 PLDc N-terminal domain-containing protein [Ancrocorticia sp.]MCI1963845.1 PLDc N-terminal domain-containing protein [Ancrocorticia sp.]MCI2002183.1 PLDc N-terminal domain-containing protein [Ancrocorticia sp.]MCI2012881.1 PLDc N-terminal domain-containing protein [Ancrocorticia sp.]